MTLGEIVIKYRGDHQLSQRQFAMKCGVSNGYISMIEKNENPATGKPLELSLPKIKAIAAAMGLTADELMRMADGDTLVSLKADQLETERIFTPKTIEARIVSFGMDDLPKEEREKILSILRTMYSDKPYLFKEERRHDDA